MSVQEAILGYDANEVEAFALEHKGQDSGRWGYWPTWPATRLCKVRLSYTYGRKKLVFQVTQENVMEAMELFTAFARHNTPNSVPHGRNANTTQLVQMV